MLQAANDKISNHYNEKLPGLMKNAECQLGDLKFYYQADAADNLFPQEMHNFENKNRTYSLYRWIDISLPLIQTGLKVRF